MNRPNTLFLALLSSVVLSPMGLADSPEPIPSAPHLLPADTIAYARIDSVTDLRSSLSDSGITRMLRDPQLQPAVDQALKKLNEWFLPVEDQLDLSLAELIDLPQGQIALALVPGNLSPRQSRRLDELEGDESQSAIRERLDLKQRRGRALAGWMMLDAGKNGEQLQVLIEGIEDWVADRGGKRETTSIGDTELVRLTPNNSRGRAVEYFVRQNTIVLGVGDGAVTDSLDRWNGSNRTPSLAKQEKFAAIMSRCLGEEDSDPQLTFYLDPYHLAERLSKRVGPLGLIWPMVEGVGISKIKGIGGSSFTGGETFESLFHVHLMIDSPRDGLLSIVNPAQGESIAPAWVPDDVSGYWSCHWDFEKTYLAWTNLLDQFGMGQSVEQIEKRVDDTIGVSVRDELKQTIDNRLVSITWNEPPINLNSQVQAFAITLKDTAQAQEVVEKIRERFPERISVDSFGGEVIYQLPSRRPRRNDGLRQPERCLVIIDGWLIYSSSRKFLERTLMANSQSLPRLRNSLQYEMVMSELGNKLAGIDSFLVSFQKDSKSLEPLYEFLRSQAPSPSGRTRIGRLNMQRFLKPLLEGSDLPPFESFEKYFGCGGSFAYDEPGGIHLGSFSLRADP